MRLMSTIRIDPEHNSLLEKLLAHLALRGKKYNKKDFIGQLIENAFATEGVSLQEEKVLEKDPLWLSLQHTYTGGIPDLSENSDKYLYKLDGE
jgi:hypothetical protein